MEVWKDIPGYKKFYQVSNIGRVKSFYWHDKPLVRIMAPTPTTYGYMYVSLRNKRGEKKTFGVHRLVALAFIKNTKNLAEVNHKDHNGRNNVVENLEWISHARNILHSYKNPNRKKMDTTRCVRTNRFNKAA